MTELIRDTVFGHFVRIVSGGKILPYAEDRDPSLWRRYVHDEKTQRMAHHAHTDEQPEAECRQGPRRSSSGQTSTTRAGDEDQVRTNALGHKVDPEHGKDTAVVGWYSDHDPEVKVSSSFNEHD